MGLVSALVGATVAAVVTPIVLTAVSGASKPPRQQGEFQVLEYSRGYRLLIFGCTLLFLGVLLLAYHFPGKTPPHQLPWILGVFAFFALFSAFTLLLMGRATVYWNAEEIEGPNLWGRRSRFSWNQLASVEYVEWAQGFRLRSQSAQVIWASPQMTGFEAFAEQLKSLGHLS